MAIRYERRDHAGPDDLRAVQDLVQRIWSVDHGWHIGDVAWGRLQHVGREPEWPTTLWYHDGRMVGWAWGRYPSGDAPASLDLAVDPAHAGVTGPILDWFAAVPGVGDAVSVSVLTTETALVPALLERGYRPVGEPGAMVRFVRDLVALPEPAVPPGYVLRPVDPAAPADLARRVAVHRAAFHPSRVTEESYAGVMAAWPYDAGLDWVVEAPDGRFAAFCLIWPDRVNGVGELEPVGTHPDFRRRGLGRAVCLAAMHRLRASGAGTAVVFSYTHPDRPAAAGLYRAMGFRDHAAVVRYRR